MRELYDPLRVAELLVIVVWIATMVVSALGRLRTSSTQYQACRDELDRLKSLIDDADVGEYFDPYWDDDDEPTGPRPDQEMEDELPF